MGWLDLVHPPRTTTPEKKSFHIHAHARRAGGTLSKLEAAKYLHNHTKTQTARVRSGSELEYLGWQVGMAVPMRGAR